MTTNPSIPYRRHIFYTVEYQNEEETFIEEVDKVIRFDDPKPPEWWLEGDTLRFVYEWDWDHNVVCEVCSTKIKFVFN